MNTRPSGTGTRSDRFMSMTKKVPIAQNVKVGDAVVYPGRGVGRITTVEQQEVAGFTLEVFVVAFDREKATLKIPTARAANQGLRRIADAAATDAALEVLSGRARKSRGMWSRRAH